MFAGICETVISSEQSLNAPVPIKQFAGILILVNDLPLQLKKAFLPIDSRPLGRDGACIISQPLKASSPIEVNVGGRLTIANFLQFMKAPAPMDVTPS